ncbi:JM164 [macacine gammaherpesvirus 11]|uniref:JM164 n=2 Tax=macacine gammaherpesvirus 11 TaxID=2560570 RepID=G9JMH1_9GAMA|nr:JM164 [Macaca fuscata rhadinovirus]AAT00141.1 JM164 [Macaca fuscata rhadinovirus]AEW87688.1 JM164 [Macaca fuscata rhadinovirus]AEW87858.1 JM164 [Macaca fuscata rhadinovirus]
MTILSDRPSWPTVPHTVAWQSKFWHAWRTSSTCWGRISKITPGVSDTSHGRGVSSDGMQICRPRLPARAISIAVTTTPPSLTSWPDTTRPRESIDSVSIKRLARCVA